MRTNPPRWPLRFLRWYCNPDYLEDIEGDLYERFQRKLEEKNSRAARWNFTKDVLKLFRPGIIRSIEGSQQLNQYAMFKNYIKVGIRNMLRYKAFSIINITGLAIGIACCALIILYVNDELSYDRYNKHYDRIYRVLHSYRITKNPGSLPPPSPEEFQVWGSAPVGPAMLEELPEIETYFRFTSPIELLFEHGSKRFQESNMVFGDSSAFKVFSWNLISGDSKTALKEPNSIVLTLSTAMKYFGYEDPIGETITINRTETFEVTGVMEDVPPNSHFTFDGLISMSTFHNWRPEIFESWGYVDFYTYLLIKENASIKSLKSKIPAFIEHRAPDWYKINNTIALEPLAEAYLHSQAARQPGVTGSYSNIYIFSCIAGFILLIACINFMNLSTARSMERAKEIGVRKSIGANKRSLIFQFLIESMLISILATLLAIALVYFSLPLLEQLSGKHLSPGVFITIQFVPVFVGSILVIGLLAGTYPAWVLARLKSTQVLKGTFKTSSKGISLRRGLVIFQFTLSITLIVGTTVVSSQLDYMQSQDLGFDQEQVMVIDFGWDTEVQKQIEFIKSRLRNHPDVISVSASRAVPGTSFPNAATRVESVEGEMVLKSPGIYEIDPDFISTYKMQMAAGRTFSGEITSDSTQALLLNETAANLYGYSKPEDIVGKKFSQWGREGVVVGVVKDFNYKSLHNKVEPLSIRFAPISELRHISLRLSSSKISETVGEIKQLWEQLVPQRPFLYSFADETFNNQYQSDVRFGKIFTAFTSTAIFIACLGLFGLTTYTLAQRTKEIGIRKTLGASVVSIVALLSKDYIKLFITAILIASPISWYLMNQWLDNFAYKTQIGPDIYLLAGIISIAIAILTVSWQSIRSAMKNPVDSLKDE